MNSEIKYYNNVLKFSYMMNCLLDFGSGQLQFSTVSHNYIIEHRNATPTDILVYLHRKRPDETVYKMVYKTELIFDIYAGDPASWCSNELHVVNLHDSYPRTHSTKNVVNELTRSISPITIEPIKLNHDEIERISFLYDLVSGVYCKEFVLASLMFGNRNVLKNDARYFIYDSKFVDYEEVLNVIYSNYSTDIRYRGLLERVKNMEFIHESA